MSQPVINPTYTEFRADGWPLCPNCGEDELYSHLMLTWSQLDVSPSVQDCIDSGMKCYRCSWESLGRNIFSGKCWRCHKFFPRPGGEKDFVYCPTCQSLVKADVERERVHSDVEAMDWPDVIA